MPVLWVILCALEVALVGRFDAQETPVGVAIALLGTLVAGVALKASRTHYAFRASWCWLPILVARNIARDTFVVFGILLRHLRGRGVRDAEMDVPFDAGEDDPASSARRALVVAGMSTSPNEIVLSVDAAAGTLRVHSLSGRGTGRHSLRWPL